jgi:glycosyltransferase involved in cell wall biosynthesis
MRFPGLDLSARSGTSFRVFQFPPAWSSLDVALSHDWLTGMRGGEKCLELLCQGFPRAPIHTLIHNRSAISSIINGHPIRTSPLQHVPGIFRTYRYWLPAFPLLARTFPPVEADLLISTSHCVAKALRTRPGAKHLCYCFTPMRYAWTFHDEYLGAGSLKQRLAAPLLGALRHWDRRVSDRVHRFIGISRHVCDRIRRFYGREADLVYPPVDTEFYTPAGPRPGDFDLIVSALVPYKRVDLAVRAYARSGRALKIVGAGTGTDRLRALAGPRTEFLGWRSNEEIRDLYRACRLLVFPGEEDFGIVPLEAQACGAPVVAFAQGGALETLVPDETAVFFSAQQEDDLLAAVELAAARRWDGALIRRNAERFSAQQYLDGLDRSLRACLAG